MSFKDQRGLKDKRGFKDKKRFRGQRRFAERGVVARLLTLALTSTLAMASFAELKPEPIPNVEKLTVPYPASYAVVHDFAFGSLIDSSFSLVDTKTRRFKGMMSAGQFATIDFSMQRQKFYVGETIHTRGSRGERQDVVAVYDFENLSVVNEIDLPPRRMNVVVNESATAITPDDKFMLVFNMNPATSVTVIDLDKEAVVNEIQTPGCSLIYPQNKGGFFTLCGNGGLVSIGMDKNGAETSRSSSEVFNDIDNDPLSEKAVFIDGVWYFITYGGAVQPIDVRGDKPRLLPRWWLTSETERAANWRPAGWHGRAGHADGLMWVAMTPDGYNGSHKDPAPQVWLVSIKDQKRLGQFDLKVPALSITASGGDKPQLLVVNIEGSLDVYDGMTGEYVHSIYALGDTPYMVHAID